MDLGCSKTDSPPVMGKWGHTPWSACLFWFKHRKLVVNIQMSQTGRLLPFKRATIENLSAHCDLAWRYECESPRPGRILSTSIVSQDVKPGWVPSGSTAWRGGLMYVAKGFPAIAENRRPFRQDQNPETPGIQLVPASGTRAIAAASRVSATRSSGSR